MDTVIRKRIEILADQPLVPALLKTLGECGVTGHTLFPAVSGAGRTGRWQDERLTGASKVLLLAIASADDSMTLIERLAPLLDSHRLLLMISDVEVVRGDRF